MNEQGAREESTAHDGKERSAGESSEDVVGRWPFGPEFFLGQLQAYVRDGCPNPEEHLPAVEVHLADGEILEVCHIMGCAPLWVALAVHEADRDAHEPSPMRTELVPHPIVCRITIRSGRKELAHLGFEVSKKPSVLTAADHRLSPEEALRIAAKPVTRGAPPEGCRGKTPEDTSNATSDCKDMEKSEKSAQEKQS